MGTTKHQDQNQKTLTPTKNLNQRLGGRGERIPLRMGKGVKDTARRLKKKKRGPG